MQVSHTNFILIRGEPVPFSEMNDTIKEETINQLRKIPLETIGTVEEKNSEHFTKKESKEYME